MRTALYRHFDAAGALLYVGISLSAVARLAQHKQTARWFDQLARVDVEWHPTREAALTAEVIAIAREEPLHNVQHAGRVLSLPPAPRPERFTYAIEHVASGWRDGNYFTEEDGDDVFAHFIFTYPQEQFRLIVTRAGDPDFPFGASNGARALRDFESHLWRMSA